MNVHITIHVYNRCKEQRHKKEMKWIKEYHDWLHENVTIYKVPSPFSSMTDETTAYDDRPSVIASVILMDDAVSAVIGSPVAEFVPVN
jgi:hypothetical protein